MSPSDHELLREYAVEKRESAFTELTQRHLNLAWGAAKRITGDAELARDVAQTTFTLLARKARFIPESVVVAGWIYRTACLESRKALRDAARRNQRESKAMELDTLQPSLSETPREIEALLPNLDSALSDLGEKDRDAVVLRFLKNRSLADIGNELGISEDAAQKRVSRALDKLRSRMKKRSATLSVGILTSVLGVASSQAAPAGMALTISVASVSSASVTAGGISALFFNLQTQAAFMKTQLIVGSLSVVAVTTPLAVQQHTLNELRGENEQLVQVAARVDALREQRNALAYRDSLAREFALLQENHEEILRLREETAALNSAEIAEKAQLSRKIEELQQEADRINHEAELLANEGRVKTKTLNDLKYLALGVFMFADDNKDQLPTDFEDIDKFLHSEQRDQIDLSRYEFFPHEEGADFPKEFSEMMFPDMNIVFREKEPRQTASGWQRGYAMFDGHVEIASSDTPDFTAWENSYRERREQREQMHRENSQ